MTGRTPLNRAPHSERGSALLIVFVFAAFVAIMLYREMPVAAFEAQRQKEQLLVDRGNEYAHAVKLYVRRFGSTYPGNIEQLENTNRIRFLRHRFKDPFTGKDDWRVLHAGPGGILIDSKVNPLSNTQNASNNTTGGNTTASNTAAGSNNPFSQSNTGSSFFSQSSSSSSTPEVVVQPVPQRPPAVAANASGEAAAAPPTDLNPAAAVLPPGQTENAATNTNSQTAPGANTTTTGTQPTTSPATANAPATASTGPNSSNPIEGVRNLLSNSSTPRTGASSSQSSMGRITSGGIAGVASKAEGHSIKAVNDQTDYSLWEFYYDPAKDTSRGLLGGVPSGGNRPAGQNANSLQSPNQSMFGPTPIMTGSSPAPLTTTPNPPK